MRNMDLFHKVYDLAGIYHQPAETGQRPIKPRRLQCSVGLGCLSTLYGLKWLWQLSLFEWFKGRNPELMRVLVTAK